jgi:transcription antitermination factor NusG
MAGGVGLNGDKFGSPTETTAFQSGFQWYALQVQTRLASISAAVLRGKGYEDFLPMYEADRHWADRVKRVTLPLFPGYLFCRFNPHDRQVPVLTSPGVIGVVGAGKVPIPVDDDEIEAVRKVVKSGLTPQSVPFLDRGACVHVETGPLKGLQGLIIDSHKGCRIVVSVTLLQRSVAVEIERDWVRPVAVTPAARARAHYSLLTEQAG